MKVLVGVGATREQLLPFMVLKHSILDKPTIHEYVVECISDWACYKDFEKKIDQSGLGTVFSLQRFLVPLETSERGFDVFIYLDSDMLCLRSLDLLIEELMSSKEQLVVPKSHPTFLQPFQTAVFCGTPTIEVTGPISNALDCFRSGHLGYTHLLRFNFDGLSFALINWIFNSRDFISDETVVFHMTDLYRQPWVSPFSNYNQVWRQTLEQALTDDVRKEVELGIEQKLYRPGLLAHRFIFSDLLFTPPQFEAYRTRFLAKGGFKGLCARSKVLWTFLVHCRAFLRMCFKYRGV